MSRIPPLSREGLPSDLAELIDESETLMGFAPNDALVIARQPELLKAMWALVAAVYGPGEVDAGLKRLIGEATSKAAGCFYCSAHAAHGAEMQGVSAEKIAAVWTFEDSELFTEAERAAISLAKKAGRVPNEAEDEDFDRLRTHFSENQIVEIMGVIAMFGFLNRWNATLGTQLEPNPAASVAKLD